tara:strand:+ start:2727 stop:3563 length:837 start_codon:yes stop_codon:yes gene_type:complete
MDSHQYLKFLKRLLPKMKGLEESLSVIIQGPLNKRINESIKYYLKLVEKKQHYQQYNNNLLGNVIISYWEGDDEGIIKNIKNSKSITLVKSKRGELPPFIDKKGSRGASPWILQNHTTLKGLRKATGNLCIKVRSDEIYPGLEIFYKRMIEDQHKAGGIKFHTSDIFFRADREEKFHISDHIIGGPKCAMISAFEKSTKECCNKRIKEYTFPEQLICKSILRSRGVEIKDYKSKQIMKENFEIVPINSMKDSIWTCSYRKYDKLTTQETGWLQDIKNI